ncbi:hypothetical protein [Adhaeribacter aquaticus]|uniref:hypothetical protein n=1 Tax=Adhaeribacter aquaticus TaxID=299567 RepID=UPI00047B891B|nr:hypothetical protein [Adhaeribacter aquaticus]
MKNAVLCAVIGMMTVSILVLLAILLDNPVANSFISLALFAGSYMLADKLKNITISYEKR